MNRYMKIFAVALVVLLSIFACRESTDGNANPVLTSGEKDEMGFLVVNLPIEGDIYYTGDVLTINWQSYGPLKGVNIFLFKKTELRATIVNNIENYGKYIWQIPEDTRDSHHYLIKVVNSENREEFKFSDNFSIFNRTGILRID